MSTEAHIYPEEHEGKIYIHEDPFYGTKGRGESIMGPGTWVENRPTSSKASSVKTDVRGKIDTLTQKETPGMTALREECRRSGKKLEDALEIRVPSRADGRSGVEHSDPALIAEYLEFRRTHADPDQEWVRG